MPLLILLLSLCPLSVSFEYLGELSANPYASDSTANPYGAGSPFNLETSLTMISCSEERMCRTFRETEESWTTAPQNQ